MLLTYYIDTDYLHSYVFLKNSSLKGFLSNKTKDEDITRYENLKKIIFNKNKNFLIKIPFIVCGEFFNTINRKDNLEVNHFHVINSEFFHY